MSHDKNPTIICPFCTWCRRTRHISNHFITNHIDKIHIRPVTNEHCVYAYVMHGKDEIYFCVCLTCGKGTLGDGTSGNSSRWIDMHSKHAACKVHHHKRLADLRESIRVAIVGTLPSESSTPLLHTLWESLKENEPFVTFMEDVEDYCKLTNDDSDDDFDPKEAIEHSIRCAVSDRNNISQHNTEMNKLEVEHDAVVCKMQDDIKHLQQHVSGLQNHIVDQSKRMYDLEHRLAMLERENKRYKTVYPELPPEDPQ